MNDKNSRDTLAGGYELHWFELQSVLGRGGYGVTYLAVDKNLDRKVAIKEYLPVDFATRLDDQTVAPRSSEHNEMYQWGLERFLKEARTLAKFNHPNIVRVISVFEQNGTAYMVMEYEQGESLSAVFKGKIFFSEEELLDIFIPVIDGLSLVHQAGFIHRDIKPSNIYIRDDGSPVLLDFGSARQSSGQTRTLTSLVTYGYAPFEQYNEGNEKQGPWTDIYSLGATLYFGITKKKPEDSMRRGGCILSKTPDPYKPVSILAKGKYSENFLLTIDNALRFRAEDRPQDAITWAQMLLGNIKAPALPAELIIDLPENSEKTMIMPQHDKPDTGERSKPNTGRLIDASGRRASTGREERSIFEHAPTSPITQAPRKKSGKKALVVGIISVLLVLGVSAIFVPGVRDMQFGKLLQTQQTKTVTTKPEKKKPQQTTGQQPKAQEIASLLKQAEQAFAAGRLVQPEGDSAAFYYLSALKQDPNNEQARAGIDKITRHYSDAAKRYLNQDNIQQAETQLAVMKSIAPDSSVTVTLQQQINNVKGKRNDIASLLMEAEQDYIAHRLTAPEGANALEKFSQVLKLEPGNREAKQGINKVFDYYAAAANSQLDAGNTAKAEELLVKMDSIKPASPEARDLKQRIKQVSDKSKQLNNLIRLGNKAYNAGQYIEPASKSAFHYYTEVLKLDSSNTSASRGIDAIRKFYKREFDKYLTQNQLGLAEKMANGLKVVENDKRLVAKVFRELQDKKKPQRPDIEVINELLSEFKTTIEAHDVKKLKAISEFSPGRAQFVDQFYANYKSVSVNVSGFEFISREHKGKASVQLVRLINNNGQPVQAGAWGKFQIVVQKNNQDQWRIFW